MQHVWLHMKLSTIICKLIKLLKPFCVNFSLAECQPPTFGGVNINEGRVAVLAEFVTCAPLQVLEVRAKKRTGGRSLVTALRTTLQGHYPEKSLALGGTFIIQKGKAKIHIMVNAGSHIKPDKQGG